MQSATKSFGKQGLVGAQWKITGQKKRDSGLARCGRIWGGGGRKGVGTLWKNMGRPWR